MLSAPGYVNKLNGKHHSCAKERCGDDLSPWLLSHIPGDFQRHFTHDMLRQLHKSFVLRVMLVCVAYFADHHIKLVCRTLGYEAKSEHANRVREAIYAKAAYQHALISYNAHKYSSPSMLISSFCHFLFSVAKSLIARGAITALDWNQFSNLPPALLVSHVGSLSNIYKALSKLAHSMITDSVLLINAPCLQSDSVRYGAVINMLKESSEGSGKAIIKEKRGLDDGVIIPSGDFSGEVLGKKLSEYLSDQPGDVVGGNGYAKDLIVSPGACLGKESETQVKSHIGKKNDTGEVDKDAQKKHNKDDTIGGAVVVGRKINEMRDRVMKALAGNIKDNDDLCLIKCAMPASMLKSMDGWFFGRIYRRIFVGIYRRACAKHKEVIVDGLVWHLGQGGAVSAGSAADNKEAAISQPVSVSPGSKVTALQDYYRMKTVIDVVNTYYAKFVVHTYAKLCLKVFQSFVLSFFFNLAVIAVMGGTMSVSALFGVGFFAMFACSVASILLKSYLSIRTSVDVTVDQHYAEILTVHKEVAGVHSDNAKRSKALQSLSKFFSALENKIGDFTIDSKRISNRVLDKLTNRMTGWMNRIVMKWWFSYALSKWEAKKALLTSNGVSASDIAKYRLAYCRDLYDSFIDDWLHDYRYDLIFMFVGDVLIGGGVTVGISYALGVYALTPVFCAYVAFSFALDLLSYFVAVRLEIAHAIRLGAAKSVDVCIESSVAERGVEGSRVVTDDEESAKSNDGNKGENHGGGFTGKGEATPSGGLGLNDTNSPSSSLQGVKDDGILPQSSPAVASDVVSSLS